MLYVRRLALILGLCITAFAQQQPVMPGTPATYTAPTRDDRIDWWAVSTFGPTSWFTGAFSSGWSTVWNSPEEWGRSPEGFAKRMATRTANVTVANGLEAGLGAVWGEDPRFVRKGQGSFGSRIGYVAKMTLLAKYRDGGTKFAWARGIGNASGNLVQNIWMPPGSNGAARITYNIGVGYSARAGSNAFREFWPDLRKKVFRK